LVRETRARLNALESGRTQLDERAIEAQLSVDPRVLLDGLFDADVAPEKLRAILVRLFPVLVFAGKRGRYTSFFRIDFAAGAALSIASDTATVEMGAVTQYFELRYRRSGGTKRWSVTAIKATEMPETLGKSKSKSTTTVLSQLSVVPVV